MASYNLSPIFNAVTTFGGNTSASAPNLPLQAGLLFTYAAGTTTPLATYQTSTGTAWTNPIVIGSDGRVSGEIWLLAGSAYKFVLEDSQGTVIRTYDNIIGVNDTSSSAVVSEWIASGATPTYSSATVFTTPGNTTSTFQVGRRVQATVTAGTVYGTITASTYGVATTVTLLMDTGQALDNGLSSVNVGFLNSLHPSVPGIFSDQITLNNAVITGVATLSGASTWSSTLQPAFTAYATGTQVTGTGIIYGTVTNLQGPSNYNTSNGIYVTPNAGWWTIDANAVFSNASGGTLVASLWITIGGTNYKWNQILIASAQTLPVSVSINAVYIPTTTNVQITCASLNASTGLTISVVSPATNSMRFSMAQLF